MKFPYKFAALTLILVGCSQAAPELMTIKMVGATTLSQQDESIIAQRLSEINRSSAPKYQFVRDKEDLTIKTAGAIEDAEISYLLTHQGVLKVRSETGMPWFNQADLADVNVAFDDLQRTVLRIQLKEPAAKRVARLSADVGEGTILALLDDEVLMTASVSAAIPDGSLQISLNRPTKEANMIRTVLSSGALSAQVKAVQIERR